MSRKRAGFTLFELLIALTILVTAMTITWSSFSTTLTAWKRGSELITDLHHGDFVMEQLVSALRSASYFDNAPEKFGLRLDNNESEYPSDMFSWVTSGTAFMPQESELRNGLHRIVVSIEDNPDGDAAFAVRAFPHLADVEDDELDPWFITDIVKGLDCQIYNREDEVWEDEWEDTNSLPGVVQITLYMDPIEKYGDPVEIKRMVEIPLSKAVKGLVKRPEDIQPETK